MFFLLQAQVLETMKDAADGVSPGSEKTYFFLVFILCAACLGLIFACYKIFQIKEKQVIEARKDVKELADKMGIVLTKVEIHLQQRDKADDNHALLQTIVTLLKK